MPVRRVRRVIRKVDPWTVLKVSFVFNAIAALVFVLGTWVMWSILVQRGIPERITELAETLTISFTPDGELYFRVVVLLAVFGTVLATGVLTLAAVLYNLISDAVGGVEVVVLEEVLVPQAAGSRPQRVRPARTRPVPSPPITDGQRTTAAVAEHEEQVGATRVTSSS
jgi:hypothetical protein